MAVFLYIKQFFDSLVKFNQSFLIEWRRKIYKFQRYGVIFNVYDVNKKLKN